MKKKKKKSINQKLFARLATLDLNYVKILRLGPEHKQIQKLLTVTLYKVRYKRTDTVIRSPYEGRTTNCIIFSLFLFVWQTRPYFISNGKENEDPF